ncbi:hypothetical protein ACQP2F_45060 [Actinoplanes sp. CA-030573]|uniref:hypothetical protein n=1 Tax=Actinoplanes sp. CA-030573 TaxID=3239898 RepID=UPI003D89FDB1
MPSLQRARLALVGRRQDRMPLVLGNRAVRRLRRPGASLMAARVPNTITDRQMAELRRRAEKAAPPMFSAEAVRRRKAASAQKSKADQN